MPPPVPSRFVDQIIEVAEREARELADLGIGILFEALKQRLAQRGQSWDQPASSKNPYQVLEVDPSASMKDVKKAFRRRVLAVHPDKGGDEDALREVLDAMEQVRRKRNE